MSRLNSGTDLLSETAHRTAAVRAQESRREDALLCDPWAAILAGEEDHTWLASRPPGSTTPIVLRTRYFDDFLVAATTAGLRQMVLLAAGLDTRAYRLTWPQGSAVYEIDRAPILQHKEAISQAGEPDAHHGRWLLPVIPVTRPDMPHKLVRDRAETRLRGSEEPLST